MTTEQLKNYIKTQCPELAGMVQLGGVDANRERFLGIYPADPGRQPMAIGGPSLTTYRVFRARLLLRWGRAQPEAEAQAQRLWKLFYGLTEADVDGASLAFADPGGGPVPLGRDADGVFEYAINLTLTCHKERD